MVVRFGLVRHHIWKLIYVEYTQCTLFRALEGKEANTSTNKILANNADLFEAQNQKLSKTNTFQELDIHCTECNQVSAIPN